MARICPVLIGDNYDKRPPKALPVRHAGLAQLVEHLICSQEVGGSSPSAGTNNFNDLAFSSNQIN